MNGIVPAMASLCGSQEIQEKIVLLYFQGHGLTMSVLQTDFVFCE